MKNFLRISNSLSRRSVGTFRLLSPLPGIGASREVTTGGNGRFSVRLPTSNVAFNVRTEWRETCALSVFRLPPGTTFEEISRAEISKTRIDEKSLAAEGIALTCDADREHVLVDASPEVPVLGLNSYLIEAVIPEYSSVNLLAASGRVELGSKVKGDCRVHLDEGDIDVHVVRGQHVHLSTGCGRVVAGELEGNVAIAATEVHAKLINGSKVQIDATGDLSLVSVGGLYSPAARIASAGDVSVSASHGSIDISTEGASGTVKLSSVTGSAQVLAGEGDVHVHFDDVKGGSRSTVRSQGGDVSITMSAELTTDLDLRGRTEALPPTFRGEIRSDGAVGKIEGGATTRTRSGRDSSGKIALDGARDQALRNFSPSGKILDQPHLLVAAPGGTIKLETLSWADSIIRNFEAKAT